jgi:hypothetical protein
MKPLSALSAGSGLKYQKLAAETGRALGGDKLFISSVVIKPLYCYEKSRS